MAWNRAGGMVGRAGGGRAYLTRRLGAAARSGRRLLVERLECRELLTAAPVEASVTLQGTDGDDRLEFCAGDEPQTWRITLNGAETEYAADRIDVKFSGGGGNDTAWLRGTGIADSVEIRPGEGVLSSDQYVVEVRETETIDVEGGGGADRAILLGGGGDVLTAGRGLASHSGEGFENTVRSYPEVTVYGEAEGKGVAYLHADPNGADVYSCGPGWDRLMGNDYQVQAVWFSRSYVYATAGGGDTAIIYDNPGRQDKLVIQGDEGRFTGDGVARRLTGFSDIEMYSTQDDRDRCVMYGAADVAETVTTTGREVALTAEGKSWRTTNVFDVRVFGDDGRGDIALLYGDPAEDNVCELSPTLAKIYGSSYKVHVSSFDRVNAYGDPDRQEKAVFRGDPAERELFTGRAGFAKLVGRDHKLRAEGFREVYAYGTNGRGDKARLLADAAMRDYFEADPKVGTLRTERDLVHVRNFDRVTAYGTAGSDDTAVMYTGLEIAEEFIGTPAASTLRGGHFLRRAVGFRYVHAYGDPEGNDAARLVDSAGDDSLVATSEYAQLSGPDYLTRAVTFREVRATAANGGDDEAVLYDTDGMDHIEAYATHAKITHEGTPRNFAVKAEAFGRVQLYSSNSDDIKDVVPGAAEWLPSEPDAGTSGEETGPPAADEPLVGPIAPGAGEEAIVEPIQETGDRPNVLFMAVDDLNDWVGALGGYVSVQTPNLDRLAARGVTFGQAYCPSPICNPSRTAVMTGYYPATSGVYKNTEDWRVALPEAVALPELFKENGYHTVGGGKIFHWNDRAIWHEYYPRISDPELETDLAEEDEYSTGNLSWGPLNVPDEEMNDYRITSWAADYLHQEHDDPFFLGCGIFRPHVPMEVPKKYFDMYPLEEIVLPESPADDLEDLPAGARALLNPGMDDRLAEAGNREKVVQAYLASVSFADAQIGRVLDALESSAYADNTVVVLWSDHGMHLGEKEHWNKCTLWEEATRVPLIVAAPGVTEGGKVVDQPVDLVSLYPTLADLCGLPVDASLDGVSLRPLLEDSEAAWDRPAITSFRDAAAVRYGQWRYIRYGDGSEELYDHVADPNERTNLAGDPAYESIQSELAAMLPQSMAMETPKRVNSALHWDTIDVEPAAAATPSGNQVFTSDCQQGSGRELWTTRDGSPPEIVADIHPGEGSSSPNQLTDWNGTVYFRADDGTHGSELWRSDGTEAGTWMVCDVYPGSQSSEIRELVLVGQVLYFRADDGVHGSELWCSDGTEGGTRLVADVVPGGEGSYPAELTAVGSQLYFRSYHADSGAELWTIDAPAESPRLVADLLPGIGSSIPRDLLAASEGVYFRASDGSGERIWYSAGTCQTTRPLEDEEVDAIGWPQE